MAIGLISLPFLNLDEKKGWLMNHENEALKLRVSSAPSSLNANNTSVNLLRSLHFYIYYRALLKIKVSESIRLV